MYSVDDSLSSAKFQQKKTSKLNFIDSYESFLQSNVELTVKDEVVGCSDKETNNYLSDYLAQIPPQLIDRIYSNEGGGISEISAGNHLIECPNLAAKFFLDACCRRKKAKYISVPELIHFLKEHPISDREEIRHEIKESELVLWDQAELIDSYSREFVANLLDLPTQHIICTNDRNKTCDILGTLFKIEIEQLEEFRKTAKELGIVLNKDDLSDTQDHIPKKLVAASSKLEPKEPDISIRSFEDFLKNEVEIEVVEDILSLKDHEKYGDLNQYIEKIPTQLLDNLSSDKGNDLSQIKAGNNLIECQDLAAKYLLDAACKRKKVSYYSVPDLIDLVASKDKNIRISLKKSLKTSDVVVWDYFHHIHGKWSEFIKEQIQISKSQHIFISKEPLKAFDIYGRSFFTDVNYSAEIKKFKTTETKPKTIRKTVKKVGKAEKEIKTATAELPTFEDFEFNRFLKENESCLLNIFTRFGIHRIVSTSQRKKLERKSEIDGQIVDIPVDTEYVVMNNKVRLIGPVLDNGRDLDVSLAIYKIYLISGRRDGIIDVTLKRINETIGLNSQGDTKATRRSLSRLASSTISLNTMNHKTPEEEIQWFGHIVDSLTFIGTKRGSRIRIKLNEYFLKHLSEKSFQIYDFSEVRRLKLNLYEKAILHYSRSHKNEIFNTHLNKFSKSIGVNLPKEDHQDYPRLLKQFKCSCTKALKSLISKDVISKNSHISGNNMIHLFV